MYPLGWAKMPGPVPGPVPGGVSSNGWCCRGQLRRAKMPGLVPGGVSSNGWSCCCCFQPKSKGFTAGAWCRGRCRGRCRAGSPIMGGVAGTNKLGQDAGAGAGRGLQCWVELLLLLSATEQGMYPLGWGKMSGPVPAPGGVSSSGAAGTNWAGARCRGRCRAGSPVMGGAAAVVFSQGAMDLQLGHDAGAGAGRGLQQWVVLLGPNRLGQDAGAGAGRGLQQRVELQPYDTKLASLRH